VVIQANFVLKRRITIDVLHDQCQFPGRELVPQFLRQLTCQSRPAGLTKADPAAGQEPATRAGSSRRASTVIDTPPKQRKAFGRGMAKSLTSTGSQSGVGHDPEHARHDLPLLLALATSRPVSETIC